LLSSGSIYSFKDITNNLRYLNFDGKLMKTILRKDEFIIDKHILNMLKQDNIKEDDESIHSIETSYNIKDNEMYELFITNEHLGLSILYVSIYIYASDILKDHTNRLENEYINYIFKNPIYLSIQSDILDTYNKMYKNETNNYLTNRESVCSDKYFGQTHNALRFLNG
jgi:hypothetical protein